MPLALPQSLQTPQPEACKVEARREKLDLSLRSLIWLTSTSISALIGTTYIVRILAFNFLEAAYKSFDNYLSFVS
jgi:hypothetical protein